MEWGSVADWVSGIGSMAAAFVALYLARRSERIHLKGTCGLRLILGQGMPRQEILSISVTNVGMRTTIINNVGISVGRGRRHKKRHGIIIVTKDEYSVGIPYTLGDGQQAHWGIPIDSERTWFKDLCQGFVKSKDDIETLRFHVYTNHEQGLTIRPDESFRKVVAETLEKLKTEEKEKTDRASGTS